MVCFLVYSFDSKGLLFNCLEKGKPIPVSAWGRSTVCLKDGIKANIGAINLMLEEEKAIETEDGLSVKISHDELSSLEG